MKLGTDNTVLNYLTMNSDYDTRMVKPSEL